MRKRAAEAANLGWTEPVPTKEQELDRVKTWGKGVARNAADFGWKAGLGAAGIYALLRALRGKKFSLAGTLGWGALGSLLGATGKGAYNVLQGRPYERTYDTSKLKPGQVVYIGVSGAGDGPGSELDRGLRDSVGEGNYAMFRHGDINKAVEFANSLPENVTPVWISHSWGGSSTQRNVPGITHRNVKFHTIDPVGWRGWFSGQKGAGTVYTPNNRSSEYDRTNTIARIGGVWDKPDFDNVIEYNGGHSKGVPQLVRQIVDTYR